ncbi:hypothetical protein [Planktothrix agardhii]|uniref:hypothetical protein n=1 Tax=Planktothrix agardhii TaxID=1160 RepID=UPI001D0B789C|nr:hypothetical protein [Planktothrix agardhii]MCB8751177.1 hypothetical protein [Planktothrix agardhii 1810]
MDNGLVTPQKHQTEDINHQQIQKKPGFNFAEIPITGNTDRSTSRIQPKFNLSLQKKLTVGEAGDKYEQEADSVAEKVVKKINTPSGEQSTSGQGVQRQEEEDLQMKPDISSQEPRGAVVESTLTPEEITYLQKFRDVANILKFNFAGSGEEVWKTHKEKYAKPGKEQMGSAEHLSGGKKYSKEKQTLDKDKTVFEYAGPISKLLGKKGLKDSGENSTEENLADAQREFNDYMFKYRIAKGRFSEIPKVQINIKGFSRGAATASVFANWIKSTMFKDVVDVNLVLIDPVHGTGRVAKGLMPSEQDVSGIYDEENAPDTSGTTYLMPIKSGHSSNYFTPQKISGYQRLIIGYGPGIKHSFGLGESEDSTLKYNGQPVKGMKLSTLPKGLFVVNAADMNIVKVPNMETWKSDFEDLVLGKANKKEKRDVVIREALSALEQYF